MTCGVDVFLVCHLGLCVVVAELNDEDVAELVGDAVIVFGLHVALVKLLLVLWKSSEGTVEDGLQSPACIAAPYAVFCHHHDFVGVAR